MITAGGNSSLKEFFNHYNILHTPPNFKYLTRASFFYRDMLSVLAQEREFDHPCPIIEEGVQLVENVYPDLNYEPNVSEHVVAEEIKAQGDAPVEEEGKKKGVWAWAKNVYAKGVNAGNKAAEKINAKVNEFSEKPGVKKVEAKALEISNKIETGVSVLIDKVKGKPAVQNTVAQVNYAADSFAREVRYTYVKINSNPSVQKLKVDTMNILKEIGSSVKGTPAPPQNPPPNNFS